jgi:hypothetical protein
VLVVDCVANFVVAVCVDEREMASSRGTFDLVAVSFSEKGRYLDKDLIAHAIST